MLIIKPKFTETDPTISTWAKEATKPAYTAEEIGAKPATYKGAYDSEIVASLAEGILALKNNTETVLEPLLTSAFSFFVVLPEPTINQLNESILIFKIGATLPTITQPVNIIWRGIVPVLAINTSWTIVYEQVNTTGTTFELWATAAKNV